jgi:hypothetical protein
MLGARFTCTTRQGHGLHCHVIGTVCRNLEGPYTYFSMGLAHHWQFVQQLIWGAVVQPAKGGGIYSCMRLRVKADGLVCCQPVIQVHGVNTNPGGQVPGILKEQRSVMGELRCRTVSQCLMHS